MVDRSCETCEFYEADESGQGNLGERRINPPSMIMDRGVWPKIEGSKNWCGKYEAAKA